jgi:hypothetical protein
MNVFEYLQNKFGVARASVAAAAFKFEFKLNVMISQHKIASF